VQFADDSLDAVGIAQREKIPEIVKGLDRSKLLRLTVPLLLPSQSMSPYSAASAVARSLTE
jgi:hypothetical protein